MTDAVFEEIGTHVLNESFRDAEDFICYMKALCLSLNTTYEEYCAKGDALMAEILSRNLGDTI